MLVCNPHESLHCCSHLGIHMTTPAIHSSTLCSPWSVLPFFFLPVLNVVQENAASLSLSLGHCYSVKYNGMSFCDTRQSIQNFKKNKHLSIKRHDQFCESVLYHVYFFLSLMLHFRSPSMYEIFSCIVLYLENK